MISLVSLSLLKVSLVYFLIHCRISLLLVAISYTVDDLSMMDTDMSWLDDPLIFSHTN